MNSTKESTSTRTGWWLALVVAGAGIAALATGGEDSAPTAKPDAPAAPADPHPTSQPQAAALPAADAKKNDVSGRVKEVLEVAQYTYLLLDRGDDEVWAAVPKAKISVGEQVAIGGATRMANFKSATLARTFDVIYFGTIAKGPRVPAGHPGSTGAADEAPTDVGKIARADGANAHTVAEIFSKKQDLAGKRIALAARVVKVTPAILDRTWLHVRDGSGSAASGDHDLIVTTSTVPKIGDEVLIEGTVAVNRDLGSGYRYDVLIEDAVVKPRQK